MLCYAMFMKSRGHVRCALVNPRLCIVSHRVYGNDLNMCTVESKNVSSLFPQWARRLGLIVPSIFGFLLGRCDPKKSTQLHPERLLELLLILPPRIAT